MVDNRTASFVRTVLIIQYYFKYFSALRGEFDQGEGDLEIVCAGNERIVCHSCIVECQSKILRRSIVKTSHDGLHLQRAQLRYVEIKGFRIGEVYSLLIINILTACSQLPEILRISNAKSVGNNVSKSTSSFQFAQRYD